MDKARDRGGPPKNCGALAASHVGAFTSIRLVSISRGRGWFIFRFRAHSFVSRPRFAQACLIKRKADPNRVDYHDHSALHYACVWGWVPTVDLLLEEGADPECSNIGAISASRGAVVPSLH